MREMYVLVGLFILMTTTTFAEKKYDYPFQNPALTVTDRVEDLIGRLTLKEKVGQMMNQTPAIPRLGIPEYDWWNEALHGVARAGKATVFPQAIALAATFDDQALFETFTMISDEARAKYHYYQDKKEYDRYKGLTFWTPNVNIFRDPRWGRGMETYGEDPYLTSKMGVAVVKGLQGNDPKYMKTHACAKHYAVHSGPEWNRHKYNAVVTPRDLRQTYLPAFEALVKDANVQEVMCAYNRFEGAPCCSSDKLLVNILRNEWDYKNIIVTDCGAVDDFWVKSRHETHPDAESASADAVLNGTDLECGESYTSLVKAVNEKKIKESDLDVSLRRLLKGRFELGMFDPQEMVPFSKIPMSVVESKSHVAKAYEMAQKSMVLLKNQNNLLPLSKKIRKIAVVGPNAADSVMLWSNYNGFPTHTVTILDGIRKKLPDAEVIYEMGCNHVDKVVREDISGTVSSEGQPGFYSEFFNNVSLEGTPVYKGNFKQLNFNNGGNTQFAPRVNLTGFSARFNGTFISTLTGDIAMNVGSGDGFRLYVNEEKVIDRWSKDSNDKKYYTLKAEKGKTYNIKIEYTQRGSGADLSFNLNREEPIDVHYTASKVKDADVIVYVGGISPSLEGEEMPVEVDGFKQGDRTNIEVPAIQHEMIKALHATGKPIVYVLCAGSAIALNWENENVDAILNAWYGGQEAGTAVADILFGDYNPSGRLPITFYKSVDQLPGFEDYTMKGRTYRYMTQTPLYPFGHGLSYTKFVYKNPKLSATKINKNQKVTLSFDIANTGKMAGDEVAQVYVKNPNDANAPIIALKGFKRVHIPANATKRVSFELVSRAFESFNDQLEIAELLSGKYQILFGGSSAIDKLQKVELVIQ